MKRELGLVLGVVFLLLISFLTLYSVASYVFPVYYGYFLMAIFLFVIFSRLDFEIFETFSTHFFVVSVILLSLPLIIGEVTRGVVRWIPIGPWTIQPAEVVRPFLLLFFAKYMTKGVLTMRRFLVASAFLSLPLALILLQPSLGVSFLTGVGFLGVLLSCDFDKKILPVGLVLVVASLPMVWFVLAPYQKLRVRALISPTADPYGIGYNSIQSMISVGSGKLIGRGLGEGVQTQLYFLPERHTDFIFAAIGEEYGFLGAAGVILVGFFVLYRVASVIGSVKSVVARSFAAGVFLTLFAQTMVHMGMNMGVFPITGVPLPLVSVGGSSLVGTMVMLGMVVGARK